MKRYRFFEQTEYELPNPAICYCSSDPPDPDPLIGQAAMSNADLSKEMAGVAQDQLAWNKQRAAVQDPLIQKIAQQQIDTSDTNTARSADQWNQYKTMFQPVEAQMVSDANNWDSDARKEKMAGQAAADVTRSYQGAQASSDRQMERMGINPSSGRFAALNNENQLSQAKDTAGAMNQARDATEQQGIALRTGVAQFGRNMPNTGIAADSLSLNAGNSAANTMATGSAINNAANNAAANWYGGATNANSSAGQIGLGLYGQQVNAWNADQQNKGASMAGFGNLMGLGGALMLRKGGIIGKPRPFRFRTASHRGGLSRYRRHYDEGGMVSGPGTGSSDSVPAVIDGVQPAALSNGEAVLNAEAVQLVGEDFIHRINAGGLASAQRKPMEDQS